MGCEPGHAYKEPSSFVHRTDMSPSSGKFDAVLFAAKPKESLPHIGTNAFALGVPGATKLSHLTKSEDPK